MPRPDRERRRRTRPRRGESPPLVRLALDYQFCSLPPRLGCSSFLTRREATEIVCIAPEKQHRQSAGCGDSALQRATVSGSAISRLVLPIPLAASSRAWEFRKRCLQEKSSSARVLLSPVGPWYDPAA